ncbi:LysR family transcriptional regulator [Paenibacillus camerounensis]|uniref:LysR family transcriptional regulator n=1 Tax=Paenibacillus camerounensis TaxID=1243663 RepID=UPI0005A91036|nr:LysR family transcriptional regulator [Paenibacillus camerounensis]
MNITKLQIVVLIEKYKKVTDVAAELGLKQPTVSFHMKSLETELGTSLFQYRSGRVLLTDAGRALYQYAVRIVSLAVEAERSLKQFSSLSSGNLELEASYIPGTYTLPKILSRFIHLHPGIDVTLNVHNDASLRERLRSRDIQLAVLHMTDNDNEAFQTQDIAPDETVLIFAPEHPLSQESELTPELVALEPWIQHEQATYLANAADSWAQANAVRLWNHAIVNSPEAYKGMVMEGGTVGIFAKAGIETELALGRLRCSPLPGIVPPAARFAYAWRKDHALTPLQQAFIDMAAEINHQINN